jgi:hypothetical protein
MRRLIFFTAVQVGVSVAYVGSFHRFGNDTTLPTLLKYYRLYEIYQADIS